MKRHHWSEDAACIGYPEDVFFPPQGKQSRHNVGLAQKVCAGCPVRVQCLTMALEAERDGALRRHGVYGGLTPKQRAALDRGVA